ncbi:MAG: hypothetical protein IBJ00_01105 [Alphaproteobacteria bacterium]|nr:hypothetical protein [Alphaproteobacteria bacterium]
MKINKLKTISIAICCFIIALCSEIKCTDNMSGLEEKTSYKITYHSSENYIDSFKYEIGTNTSNMALSFKNESEDSKTSWMSYLLYPAKNVIRNTNGIINFATQSPKKAIITGLVLAYHMAVVAAECDCWCRDWEGRRFGITSYFVENTDICESLCNINGYEFYNCYPVSDSYQHEDL